MRLAIAHPRLTCPHARQSNVAACVRSITPCDQTVLAWLLLTEEAGARRTSKSPADAKAAASSNAKSYARTTEKISSHFSGLQQRTMIEARVLEVACARAGMLLRGGTITSVN